MASIAVQQSLDLCTYQGTGKTWMALLTGLGGKYGVTREFVNGRSSLSRSGRTGTITYTLTEPGVYESHESREGRGRRWWKVTDDSVITEITEQEALDTLKAQP